MLYDPNNQEHLLNLLKIQVPKLFLRSTLVVRLKNLLFFSEISIAIDMMDNKA